jgi:uncharacterized protein DUF1206
MNMTSPTAVRGSAGRAANSDSLAMAARIGLLARGVVYALIGILAAQVALGDSERTDQQGALQKIADQPFGRLALGLIALGFLAYGLWRIGEGLFGRKDEGDQKKRAAKKTESLVSGLFYLLFSATAAKMALGGGSGGNKQKDISNRVLDATGGRTIFVVLGLVIVGVSLGLIWRGVTTKFEELLKRGEMSGRTYAVVRRLGQAGYVARGCVFALVGVLVIKAALDHDAAKAGGLDVALKSVADAPFGKFLLLAAAAGLVCFGAYSCAEARFRRL